MARLRVHVVFAIIQRLLALGRSSMKPKLYVGLRVARRGFGLGPLMISYQLAVFNASYATKPVESNNGSLRKQEQAKIPATVLRIWFDGLAGDDVASTL
ncbi:hypothetical protein NA56DRAFT_701959 [Hyaloscypha hepaticicola]|uniref:Uncharacterized protein n=1 Tax=Hyaloscypha hepaticicola TaxID=2082293 RepID=A0A2J6Q9F6_9HELO|nr:hypothetical protein NA56DRAFT_701959 [Hyaloscypha hepaticicola]